MRAILKHETRAGTFFIARSTSCTFHPVFLIGSYRSIALAIDDLVNDATDSVLHPITS